LLYEKVPVYFHHQAGEQCNQMNRTWNERALRKTHSDFQSTHRIDNRDYSYSNDKYTGN